MKFDDVDEIDEQIMSREKELDSHIRSVNKLMDQEWKLKDEIGKLKSLKTTIVKKRYNIE